jgi:hypothetical protein
VIVQKPQLYLVFELLTMDLKEYMDTNVPKDGQMDAKLVKSYTYQLLQASHQFLAVGLSYHCSGVYSTGSYSIISTVLSLGGGGSIFGRYP